MSNNPAYEATVSLNHVQELSKTRSEWGETIQVPFKDTVKDHVDKIQDALTVLLSGVYAVTVHDLTPVAFEYTVNNERNTQFMTYQAARALFINASLENMDMALWDLRLNECATPNATMLGIENRVYSS